MKPSKKSVPREREHGEAELGEAGDTGGTERFEKAESIEGEEGNGGSYGRPRPGDDEKGGRSPERG